MPDTFNGSTYDEHLAAFEAEQPGKGIAGFQPSDFRETTYFHPVENQTMKCVVIAEDEENQVNLVYVLQAAEGEKFLVGGTKYFLLDTEAWEKTAC